VRHPIKEGFRIDGLIGSTWILPHECDLLIKHANGGHVLEVGTASGLTAARLAASGCRLTCIDTFIDLESDHVLQVDGDRWTAWRKNVPADAVLWRGDLTSFVANGARWFDMVLVDADHLMPNVAYDIFEASRITDTIACHDYCDWWPDVARAVNGFCRRYGWEITDSDDTMVILRKA